jgi:putative selenium metabolism protein SsnA
VLANATLADLSTGTVRHGHVEVADGRIAAIHDRVPEGQHDLFDCSGRVVMPGNVCAHTHLYSALARGMPGPPRTPRNFVEFLELVWWRLDRALDGPSVRSSGLVGALDAVRSGTTSLVDHHASPEFIDGSLDVLADALSDVGVRAILCYEVTDRGGPERTRAGLRENERFLLAPRRRRIRGMVGAHASFTLGDESLDALADLADRTGTGVHIHVAEDVADEGDSLRRCGERVAYRLAGKRILRPRSIAAHCVHVDRGEIMAIEESGSWFVHNCRSNMNNGVGRAPVALFGNRTALGTDGIDEDMFAESRTAYFRSREDTLDAFAEETSGRLAAGGQLVSEHFDMPVGTLDPGVAADLMVLDYDPPTPLDGGNLAWHWAFALTAGTVDSVMIDGRWVLRHREFPYIDEERIRAEARTEAAKLWSRMESL